MISKNIFQTFYTKKIPTPIVEIIDKLKQNNPEYNYYFYDDDEIIEFIKNSYTKEILNVYNKLQIGAAKADFWRYLILYKFGGVYIDLDSKINIPIDNIINKEDKALITRERNPNSFVQWCLFFEQNHPILKLTIKKVIENINSKQYQELDFITGPPVISEVIEKYYKHLNLPESIYKTPDLILNDIIKDVRFDGFDYEGKCTFKYPESCLLYEPYMNKKPWKEEQVLISPLL